MTTARYRAAAEEMFRTVAIDGGLAFVASKTVRTRAYNAFLLATAPDIYAMALHIMRRWRLPTEVECEDIEQVIRFAVWRYLALFDESKGTTYDEFLRFNSFAAGKKYAHKARGAILHGNADAAKSRCPVYIEDLVSMAGDNTGKRDPDCLRVEPKQETDLELSRANKRTLLALKTQREYHALDAFLDADGDVLIAADALMSTPELRRATKIRDEDEAMRVIVRTVKTVTARIAQANQ